MAATKCALPAGESTMESEISMASTKSLSTVLQALRNCNRSDLQRKLIPPGWGQAKKALALGEPEKLRDPPLSPLGTGNARQWTDIVGKKYSCWALGENISCIFLLLSPKVKQVRNILFKTGMLLGRSNLWPNPFRLWPSSQPYLWIFANSSICLFGI